MLSTAADDDDFVAMSDSIEKALAFVDINDFGSLFSSSGRGSFDVPVVIATRVCVAMAAAAVASKNRSNLQTCSPVLKIKKIKKLNHPKVTKTISTSLESNSAYSGTLLKQKQKQQQQ